MLLLVLLLLVMMVLLLLLVLVLLLLLLVFFIIVIIFVSILPLIIMVCIDPSAMGRQLQSALTTTPHWLESYVEHLLTRDAEQVDVRRDPVRLRRYLEAYVLTNLLVVESVPAWASN